MGKKCGIFSCDKNTKEKEERNNAYLRVNGVNKISDESRCEEGLVLSNYGDSGWGILVSEGKYKNDYFDDSLVEASVALLEKFVKNNNIQWVTNIPSLRHPELVKSFAKRLSERLELSYYEAIEKITNNVCQKELNTSYLQYNNANSSFEVGKCPDGNVLLVDDMVDSRWTFTVCGYKLREKGSGKVFPFALANSAGKEEG